MKTAIIAVEAINLTCPYCQEVIPSPNGSHYWTEDEHGDIPDNWQCGCGERFKKPAWPKRKAQVSR